tara:strand:+ start:239 stop:925 length:687 start_codon:yes stop_codon:yes gene_type:complete
MVINFPHILVIDDDDRLRNLLCRFLRENDFLVTTAPSADSAREKMAIVSFDLLILDLMMPGETGLEFAQKIRMQNNVPILMLTAMGELEDRIAGLENGADDYMVKPFEPRELLLRVRSILRRTKQEKEYITDKITLGSVVFTISRGELERDGVPIHLTESEITLLVALAERPGQVVTRERLIELTEISSSFRAIDVQVTRLRRKIEADSKLPRYLQTVRGKGYMLRPD